MFSHAQFTYFVCSFLVFDDDRAGIAGKHYQQAIFFFRILNDIPSLKCLSFYIRIRNC